MRKMVAIACAWFGAACSSGGRYLVDAELLRMIDAPPPLAVRIDDTHRRVGFSTVEISCTVPGSADEGAHYRGTVFGPGGSWEFSTKGPIVSREASCDDPARLDEMAEEMALRYRKARGAVPAVNESTGEEVYLDQHLLQMETRIARGRGVSIEARGTNSAKLTAAILGGFGTGFGLLGAVTYGTTPSCPSDPKLDTLGCDVSTSINHGFGELLLITGGLFLGAAAISAIVSLFLAPQELPPDRPDRIYFKVPTRAPPAPEPPAPAPPVPSPTDDNVSED